VDRETGKVDILRVAAAQDVGKALNPRVVEGQILGGLIQGLGYATMEDYVFDEGHVLNRSLYDYRVPTSMDIPPIEIEMIEKPDPIGPYGAKGVGEPSIVPPPPAISNAIYDAVGVWPAELPITAERVYWLLQKQANGSSSQSGSNGDQG
jgi:CO/xanthine dehydrogenase Mo-binding subunit